MFPEDTFFQHTGLKNPMVERANSWKTTRSGKGWEGYPSEWWLTKNNLIKIRFFVDFHAVSLPTPNSKQVETLKGAMVRPGQ